MAGPPAADAARSAFEAVAAEVAKVVVGQAAAVEAALVALLAGGHVLLEGVPGTAKTLMARALARALDLDGGRIQFTPDLMPSDVTGQMVLAGADLVFRPGPVFTNVLLADEVNRTPPKTQAALLEAMQEATVTVAGVRHPLPQPFVVLATQNPVEYEGTYPLPEAQLDRFLLQVDVGYPSEADEQELLRRHHRGLDPHDLAGSGVEPVAGEADVAAARQGASAVAAEDSVIDYVAAVVRATRAAPSVALGASPRGGVALLRAAKARAWLDGAGFVTPDHVKAVAPAVLQHRLVLRPEAELDGSTGRAVVGSVLASVPVPR